MLKALSQIPRRKFSSMPKQQETNWEEQNAATKFSQQEERQWDRLSVGMKRYHDYFKHEFNTLYLLADGSFAGRGLSLPRFIGNMKDFHTHLNTHHVIEEAHIFPVLAKRMPTFAEKSNGEHVKSHKAIHDGLDALEVLMKKYNRDNTQYSPDEFRACLDGFRDVLFRHLDEEVADLKGSNMKKFWSLQELERIPM